MCYGACFIMQIDLNQLRWLRDDVVAQSVSWCAGEIRVCGMLEHLKRVWRSSVKWWWWPRVDRLWSSLCSAESVGKTMTKGKATSMVSNTSRIWRSFSARLERRFKMFDYILRRRFDCRTKNGVATNFGAHFAIRTLTKEGACTFGTCDQLVDVYLWFHFYNKVITNVVCSDDV